MKIQECETVLVSHSSQCLLTSLCFTVFSICSLSCFFASSLYTEMISSPYHFLASHLFSGLFRSLTFCHSHSISIQCFCRICISYFSSNLSCHVSFLSFNLFHCFTLYPHSLCLYAIPLQKNQRIQTNLDTLTREVFDLQETINWKDKKIGVGGHARDSEGC